MNDVQKFNLKQAGTWLSGEVEIRMPKLWLVAGGIALVVLLIIAFD
ncbi:MAG: hypothetical protein NWQ23_09180 [Yoonia sp.]|nr:hypothetical protein [Yoonia sp.]MDP5085579.1 hypothetical protein [Yoonia sp.]MDP5361196.1 hypothetical protein [Paracoccaceae bacterium]